MSDAQREGCASHGPSAVSIASGGNGAESVAAANGETTVFIVDNDDAVRAALSLLVHSYGLEVEAFASAEEFLDAYPRGRAGCLLLDLHMPGMKGPDLQDALAALGIHLPVIIVTGYKDDPLAKRALEAGAVAVLAKPFRHEELMRHVQIALGRPH